MSSDELHPEWVLPERDLPERLGSVIRLEAAHAFGLPETYRGRDERLRRDVLLRPLRWQPGDTVRRAEFLRAAAVVAQIDDPRLVQIHDCLPDEEGTVDWMILESLEGRPLGEVRLARGRRLQIAQDVVEVLAELHGRGACHGGVDDHGIRVVGDRGQIKILAPGRRSESDRPPSQASDMRAFGEWLRDLLGEELGRLESLIAGLTSNRPAERPSAVEASRRLSDERSRPRRLRRRFALWLVAAAVATWAGSFTLSLRSSLADTVAAREDAVRAKAEAEELSSFLVGLFRSNVDDPRSDKPTAKDLLDRGARRIDRDFADRPQVRSRLLLTLGDVYEGLGSYDRAQRLLEDALRLRQDDADTPLPALAEAQAALGHVLRYQGEYEEALAYLESALAVQTMEFGEDHEAVAETLNGMAIVERRMGDYEAAEENYLRSLEIRERVLGPMDPSLARGLNNLALLYYYQGRLDEAEVQYRRSLEIKKATLPPNHPSIALAYNNLGNLMADRGRFEDAESFYRSSLEIRRKVAGEDHPETASSVNNLGLLYMEWGRLEQAEEYLRRTLEIREKTLGLEHADYALSLSNLGTLLEARGRFDESRRTLERALGIQRRVLGDDHPDVGLSLDRLASLHLARGEPRRARDLLEQSYEINRNALGDDNPDTAYSLVLLGRCALALGDVPAATDRLTAAVEIYRAAGFRGAKMVAALEELASAQEAAGRDDEAAATRERIVEMAPDF